MSFEPRKYKDIFDEMRAMSQVVTDFEVGSVARTMYESFAYEMALLYEKMNLVYLSAYVDSARGNQLDQVVAVLGIQRSQPDFAEGTVIFSREGAGQEIIIPIGTLVATEETSTGEKKVYQTAKEAVMAANRTEVDVQIRAAERGEELEATADTVVVMPRPVPGIKFVNNNAPIRLVGKRRETDEELRERAKNALISSGKATSISIENALLSLSGVRDARVQENFHFPRAVAKITNDVLFPQGITIPRGTLLSATIQNETYPVRLLDPVAFLDTDLVGTEKEVKVESFIEGKSGEREMDVALVPVVFQDNATYADLSAAFTTDLKLEDFGLIEVYVDAPRLDEGTPSEIQAERQRIEAEIERVRAAGIFSILRPAGKLVTSAIFRIDIAESLNLSPEERRSFEEAVEDEIVGHMADLRMGKPLLFGKLIQAILNLDNIENVADFRGTVVRQVLEQAIGDDFTFSDPDKFIEVEAFERIKSRHICVATEDKAMPINLAFQASGLDAAGANAVTAALNSFFGDKALGDTVLVSDIETEITNALLALPGSPSLNVPSLDVQPESWCPGPVEDPRPLLEDLGSDQRIAVSFVEQPVTGTVFGYADRLELTGAIKLILPLNVSVDNRTAAEAAVTEAFSAYLRNLGPEEDVVFAEVVTLAEQVPQVLAAEVEPSDFLAFQNALLLPTAVDRDKVDVGPLVRAFPEFVAVSGATIPLSIRAVNLSIQFSTAVSPTDQTAVQLAIRNAFNNGLAGAQPGEDVEFARIKSNLENLAVSFPYTVTQLDLQADSLADARVQNGSLSAPADIHVRSVELPVIVPIQITDVAIVP
ncbi:MAG: baseplate J/gp47 family protein [Bacteroidota bacterium]